MTTPTFNPRFCVSAEAMVDGSPELVHFPSIFREELDNLVDFVGFNAENIGMNKYVAKAHMLAAGERAINARAYADSAFASRLLILFTVALEMAFSSDDIRLHRKGMQADIKHAARIAAHSMNLEM